MKHYIDAEKLKAEIGRLHKAHSGKYGCDEVGLNLEYLEDFIDSLKQEMWKPTEEQMEALQRASVNEYLSAEQFDILVSLYEQLKKLT